MRSTATNQLAQGAGATATFDAFPTPTGVEFPEFPVDISKPEPLEKVGTAHEFLRSYELQGQTSELASEEASERAVELSALARLPLITASPRATSQLVAEWHGCVAHIHEDSFVAELRGRYGDSVQGSHELASIPLSDVSADDVQLLREGAFFRLCISYELSLSGTKRRYTEVIFRRLPAYRQVDLDAAKQRGLAISRGLRGD